MAAFIPLFLSALATKAAPKLIDAIVDRIVSDPANPVTPDHASSIRKEVAPVVEQATKKGRNPILWGAIGSVLSGLSALAMAYGNGDGMEAYLTGLSGVLMGLTTLVGVWKAAR